MTVGWAAEAHFLLVETGSDKMLVTPIGGSGRVARRTR